MGVVCEHCQGEVNVSMHNGATLRCGCGKTTVDAGAAVSSGPTTPASTAPPAERGGSHANHRLLDLLLLMRENKALRVRAGDLEVELHPDAFAPAWSAQTSTMDATEKPCRCGHSIPVQHNPEGQCLEGCEPDACAEKAAA